jgi:TetR/AcrR family transcriptional regulator, ethionamide resistance regulator
VTSTNAAAGARRLTDQGRERRQQLLDQAAVLFAERGYANTRVVDICQAAGVAKGLFYWYFENKEQLFAELVRSMRLALRRAQGAAIDLRADPLTRIRQGTEASVRFMAQHRAFFALLEVEERKAGLSAVLSEGTDVHLADVEIMVKEAQSAGLVDDGADPSLLALGVVGTVAYFSHFHRSGRIEHNVDALASFVGEWVVRALAGETGPI